MRNGSREGQPYLFVIPTLSAANGEESAVSRVGRTLLSDKID